MQYHFISFHVVIWFHVFQIFTLSGLCSGLTEAVVINPFEVVKVKLQAERNVFKEVKYVYHAVRVYKYIRTLLKLCCKSCVG